MPNWEQKLEPIVHKNIQVDNNGKKENDTILFGDMIPFV
jgi:hypothetical protein